MAAAIFLSLLLYALCTIAAEAQQRQSNIISLGSSLTPTTANNSSWLSHSGLYAFGFYRQGNGYAVGVFLVGIPEQNVVWTANRNDPPVLGNATLMLTSDGRLVLQSTDQGQDINIADYSQPASSASMLDSGNFVIYNSNQMIIWESFDHPTDTLLPGQRLSARQQLFSSSSETDRSTGIFRLNMQADGNLVQYPVNTPDIGPYAYWASGTSGVGENVTLNLDDNGHLYLLNSNTSLKNLTQATSTKGKIYLLKLDVNGILRLYSRDLDQRSNFSAIWSSSTDRCVPKGLCGLNGYCILLDDVPDCRCLPGFDSVSPGNWSSGCERNFTAEGCKDDDRKVVYAMRELQNTQWEDISYLSLSLSKDDCEKACLEDCNCEAALFSENGRCSKQRLPLRYGRRLLSDSTIALIKVATSSTPTVKDDLPGERKKELRVGILIVSVSFLVIAFIVLVISGAFIYRNHVYAYRKISETGNVELYEDVAPWAFTYAELEKVTDGFKEEVGKGSFRTVYKGIIMKNQKVVAVKRLDKVLAEGEREFQTEMKVIGKTHHRNLVRLLGYCLDGPKRLLVYEFMANGSLADLLFPTSLEKRTYNWDERISIALDIARGILYLHEECETQIIHCDIKPQNILMDEYRCAKIADFGLAKLLKPDQTNTFTGIRGTRGYVAPEWHRKLPVTVKADVYSYGIVLFEIICCRRSVDWSLSEDEAVLEEWVYECFQSGEVGKLVGDEEVDKRKLERMARVGLWCIQDEPSLRPSMKKVLLMLEGTVDIPIPPSPTSFLSTI